MNFVLGAGLHAYGFGAGGVEYVGAFVALDLIYVGYVVYVKKRTRTLGSCGSIDSMRVGLIIAALSLGGIFWCAGCLLFVFGMSLEVQPWLRGLYHAYLIGFPFALIAVLVLLLKASHYAWTPIYALLSFGVLLSAWNVVDQLRESRQLKRDDAAFVPLSLDGFLDVEIPKSFHLEERQQLVNFYYLEPLKDQFTYAWKREVFPHVGGEEIRSKLLIRVYAETTQVPDVAALDPQAYYDQGVFNFKSPVLTSGDVQVFRNHIEPPATIYLATTGRTRVTLSCVRCSLSESSAIKMIETIVRSLKLKRGLVERSKEIETQFYSENPDKKPPAK